MNIPWLAALRKPQATCLVCRQAIGPGTPRYRVVDAELHVGCYDSKLTWMTSAPHSR